VRDARWRLLPAGWGTEFPGSAARLSFRMSCTPINSLLEIYKFEEGKVPLALAPLLVEPLLQAAVERLSPLAVEAHIDISVTCAPDLPPLCADHKLLERVLNNLIDNAIKFSPDNSRIDVWTRADQLTGTPALLIGVQDAGRGISPVAQAKLFKKFQQEVVKSGRRVGSGLGLPFCKLIVEAHGGQIWVESAVGQGSTFFIRLPLIAPTLENLSDMD